jgi:hypothetical protein
MTITADTRIGCNGTTGWGGTAVPCRNYYNFANVNDCHSKLLASVGITTPSPGTAPIWA